jgi:hypothetical protein
MKAKTLLIAAAALAAGVMHSQAQVYSQNIVGYINVPLNPGYNLVANQLDLDGTGTNNSLYTSIGTNLPANTQVLAWGGSSYITTKLLSSGKWLANNQFFTNAVNPGSGFFLNLAGSVSTNITFVGNVITGTNSYPVVAGYQIVAPSAPVAGTLDTTNGYRPSKNDQVVIWNNSTASYTTKKFTGTTWLGGDPQLTVGQAVFLNASSNNVWSEVLNVQ